MTGRAVVRIRDVSGDRLEATRLREQAVPSYQIELDAVRRRCSTPYHAPHGLREATGTSRLDQHRLCQARLKPRRRSRCPDARGTELLETSAREAAAGKRSARRRWFG